MLLSDLPADSPLDPGRYVVSVDSAPQAPLLPVLSVPEGYMGVEGGIGVYADGIEGGDVGRIVWAWVVNRVYPHPCSTVEFAETVGPSVADLANALAAQALRPGTAAPVPVTVGGYDGLYVELTVPDGVDVEACPEGRFNMWPGRWQDTLGQVDMVWIVDVEGQRIVFDASHFPGASSEEVAELRDMVTTATFEPAEDS